MPDIKPIIPNIVEPDGVNCSIEPRPMDKRNDEDRAKVVKETGGAPIVDYDGRSNPYIDYQSVDLLHSLQHLRSEGYDEMCFFIMDKQKNCCFATAYGAGKRP